MSENPRQLCPSCGQRGHTAARCWQLAPCPPPEEPPPKFPPRGARPPPPHGLKARAHMPVPEMLLCPYAWRFLVLRLLERSAIGLAWRPDGPER